MQDEFPKTLDHSFCCTSSCLAHPVLGCCRTAQSLGSGWIFDGFYWKNFIRPLTSFHPFLTWNSPIFAYVQWTVILHAGQTGPSFLDTHTTPTIFGEKNVTTLRIHLPLLSIPTRPSVWLTPKISGPQNRWRGLTRVKPDKSQGVPKRL